MLEIFFSFINLIWQCIFTPTFEILLNDTFARKFNVYKGLHQGDSFSFFLFIIITEFVTQLIYKVKGLGEICSVRVARLLPSITHLLFADDLVLFCRVTIKEVCNLIKYLYLYYAVIGQEVNFMKLGVFFSKNIDKRNCQLLGCKLWMHEIKEEVCYLGNPMFLWSKMKVLEFLKDKVKKRLTT